MKPRHRRMAVFGALLVMTAAVRLPTILAPSGLWADEVSSLAIATGHSLEHPAETARPEFGDFVERPLPERAAVYHNYLEFDSSPSFARMIRAVWVADTNPPLFYLVLHTWARVFGTTDGALRVLPVLFALTAVPFLWFIGRRLAGYRGATLACLLYAVVPAGVYYSQELRTYSLVWLLAACMIWSSIRLHDGANGRWLVVWIMAAACGMLAHYFFTFVWLASALWLLLTRRLTRRRLLAGMLSTVLLITPWYAELPGMADRWRVTGEWLDGRPEPRALVLAPAKLAWALVSPRGAWGDQLKTLDRILRPSVFALLIVAVSLSQRRKGVVRGAHLLLWLCILAAVSGPVSFDLLRETHASSVPRYALAALPAMLLLVSTALVRLRPVHATVVLLLLLAAWAPGTARVLQSADRQTSKEVAQQIAEWAGPNDVIIARSHPAAVLTLARYLPADLLLVPWIPQLGEREVPADLGRIVEGRAGAALFAPPMPGDTGATHEEAWFRSHALIQVHRRRTARELLFFRPAAGPTFQFQHARTDSAPLHGR